MAPIQESKKVKVILTGFEPFGSHLTNPSWLSIQPLHNTTLELPPSTTNPKHGATGADVFCQELPVEYRKVPDLIQDLHNRHSRNRNLGPKASGDDAVQEGEDVIQEGKKVENYLKTYYIHLGVGRDGYTAIETLANRTGYQHPDNAQWSPESLNEPPVKKDAWSTDPDQLFTTVDSAALAKCLGNENNWTCQQSTDAGHYLCEYTFYLSMAERQRRLVAGEEGEDERTCLFVHLPSVGNPYSLEQLQQFVKDMVIAVVNTY
ncbi:MAG: hypothetical protein J3Q66DRAFT_317388 [Benniella sp.]|nr:MAG: hypothetical protein J3Q66DRAFT_317388 [Benniella sp.]